MSLARLLPSSIRAPQARGSPDARPKAERPAFFTMFFARVVRERSERTRRGKK
jgi:hypothetical protein